MSTLLGERVDYQFAVVQNDGGKLFIQEAVTALSWDESEDQFAARLTAEVSNERLRNRRLAQLLANGAQVRTYAGTGKGRDDERFRGRIFSNTSTWRDGERMHSIVAYDALYYLLQSEDDRYYPAGKTGEQILRDIFRAWGIPHEINGPHVKLSKKVFRGATLAEMVTKVLDETKRKGGGTWLLRGDEGKVRVVRRGGNRDVLVFESDSTHDLAVDRSIESLVTRVRIVGRSKGGSRVLATADSDLRDDFGTMQRIVNRADYDTAAQAKKAAKRLLDDEGAEQKTRLLEAPDNPAMRMGHRVKCRTGTLDGFYFVRAVAHNPMSRTMIFEVDRRGDDAVEIEFETSGLWDWIPPDDRGADATGTKGGTPGTRSRQGYQWPVRGTVTGEFGDAREGHTHAGIDIAAPRATSVLAARPGVVRFVGVSGGYGNLVIISHENDYSTYYAHLQRTSVRAGAKVGYGSVIGTVNSTGNSTGDHLHFETRRGGSAFDPRNVLP